MTAQHMAACCSTSGCSSSRPSSSQGGRLTAAAAAHPIVQRGGPAPPLRGRHLAASGSNSEQSRRELEEAVKEQDLWQIPNREAWYQATWCAADQPDWSPARFVRSTQLAPGVREVVVECEISREKVPLRNAYKHVGQRASLRVNSGAAVEATPASPPFPQSLNREALLRVRGDMLAGETKTVKEEISVLAELALCVREEEAPELYRLSEEDSVEVGPFTGGGLQLRGPVSGVFLYPTVILFAEGAAGIATAKSLIQATSHSGGLSFKRRTDVRMYYRAPNEASLCYREQYDEWAERYGVQVITSTRDTFADMFDDDQTLMYDPDSTAAIILTGGAAGGEAGEEAEAAAAEVCREADITVVVRQSEEAAATEYLKFGKPQDE